MHSPCNESNDGAGGHNAAQMRLKRCRCLPAQLLGFGPSVKIISPSPQRSSLDTIFPFWVTFLRCTTSEERGAFSAGGRPMDQERNIGSRPSSTIRRFSVWHIGGSFRGTYPIEVDFRTIPACSFKWEIQLLSSLNNENISSLTTRIPDSTLLQ